MTRPNIPGGYIIISRNIVESEIFDKPPLYLKVWLYLLTRAQHTNYKKLKRGQLITSIPEIMEACSWKVGFRKVTPTEKEVRGAIDWLRKSYEGNDEGQTKGTMISTTKVTHGLLINIDNYSFYQDPKNYEGRNEGRDESSTKVERRAEEGRNINKNVKNDKNDKYIHDLFDHYCSKKIINHQKLTEPMKRAVNARLKDYSFDELKKAIDNYAIVYSSDKYWFTHKYPFADFMRDKDIRKFIDEADPLNNFKKNENNHEFRQQKDPRNKEIEFQKWITEGHDPNDFNWSD